jgi:capsular exopolysaccharide synthesis family protein
MLVSDPLISAERRSGGADQGDLRELALKTPGTTNIPDLIEVLRSPLLLQPIAAKVGVSEGSIAGGLNIANASSEGVIDVNLEWNEPRQGLEILEALRQSYLSFALIQRQEKLAQGLSFLDDQAPALVSQVVDLQEQLSSFRKRNDFLEPLKQGEAIQSQRQQLDARLGELRQQEAQLLGSLALVQAGNLSGPSSQASGGPLAGEVSDLQKQLAEAEASFLPDSPQVRSLRDRLNEVRPLLQRKQLEAIESSLVQVRSEQAEVERQDRNLSIRFASNPGLVKQYEAIQQRLEVARQNLSSYIRTREDFRLEEAQRTVPWRVISPPRFSDAPAKPDLGRNLLFSLLLGGIAGGGAALLRDKLDNVFHSSRDVDQALALPVLGRVPFLPLVKGTTVSERIAALGVEPNYALKESLLNLYTSLRRMRSDKSLRMIALTSTVQHEGKSLVLTLLAQTLSELGQRVLLVDADLRAPTLHEYLGVENDSGLSSLLTDDISETERLIHPVNETLHLLTAGPAPPDAPRLLSSRRCAEVVNQILTLPGYDIVLFDTSPTLDLSDTLLLCDKLDGILFLVSLGRVDRDLTTEALKRIKSSNLDVLGLITNQVFPSTYANNSYGHRNRQHNPSNYGYGAEEVEMSHGKGPGVNFIHLNNIPPSIHKLLHWFGGRV